MTDTTPKDTHKEKPTTLRLSDDGWAMLRQLTAKLGISQKAVMELAIRSLAKQEGIER
jgi:biotin operon repressor